MTIDMGAESVMLAATKRTWRVEVLIVAAQEVVS